MSEKHPHKKTRANPQAPVTNIVTYVPKKGKEAELLELVRKHEPALPKVGLVTGEPFCVWKRSSSSTSCGKMATPVMLPTGLRR